MYQLYITSALLLWELNDAIFVDEMKIYKLKRIVHGLKQASQAWYICIEDYFKKECFERCPCKHAFFMNLRESGNIVIVILYIYDLTFTGIDYNMLKEFKMRNTDFHNFD